MLERLLLAIGFTVSMCLSIERDFYNPSMSSLVQRPAIPDHNGSQVR